MNYIVFDLEFNQNFSSLQDFDGIKPKYPFEIIQIGAIKLDLEFKSVATFNRYIKPTIYTKISPFITELTGITTDQLVKEEPFSEVYKAFIEFIDDIDSVFCVWGMSDIKELFKSVAYHKLNINLSPKMFINLQPYVSTHFNLPSKNLLSLQHTVEAFDLPIIYTFHNALYDAYYTAEVFKKIYNLSIEPKLYDPSYVIVRPRQQKRVIDVDKLLQQFEKMYARELTCEEQNMIKLAYKMGKTNQFLK